MNDHDRQAQLLKFQAQCYRVFMKKNADYGDSFAAAGPVGVMVRLQDKLSRYLNISSHSVTLVEDETLLDTLHDLANYCAMAAMLLEEKP